MDIVFEHSRLLREGFLSFKALRFMAINVYALEARDSKSPTNLLLISVRRESPVAKTEKTCAIVDDAICKLFRPRHRLRIGESEQSEQERIPLNFCSHRRVQLKKHLTPFEAGTICAVSLMKIMIARRCLRANKQPSEFRLNSENRIKLKEFNCVYLNGVRVIVELEARGCGLSSDLCVRSVMHQVQQFIYQ